MDYKQLYKYYYNNKDEYINMYNARFNSESTYRFDFKINNDTAFVVLTPEILNLITSIRSYNSKISKILSDDSFPPIAVEQFERECLVDEIKLSNEIEGVHSTRKEILEAYSASKQTKQTRRIYGIVQKYKMLLSKDEIPLHTCEDIRTLYNELVLDEVISDDNENIPDGEFFRKKRVYVQNNRHEKIHAGLYPEEKIVMVMSQLLNFINNNSCEPLISIAVFHYMFGYIHPFYDGNGRMSRFISSYLLSKELEPITGYRLAYTIKSDLKSYYRMFNETNNSINKGDITAFVIYFLNVLKTSLENLYGEIFHKLFMFANYETKTYSLHLKINEHNIFSVLIQNALFATTGLTVDDISGIINKSTTTVRKILDTLSEKELIIKNTEGRQFYYTANINELDNIQ